MHSILFSVPVFRTILLKIQYYSILLLLKKSQLLENNFQQVERTNLNYNYISGNRLTLFEIYKNIKRDDLKFFYENEKSRFEMLEIHISPEDSITFCSKHGHTIRLKFGGILLRACNFTKK